MHWKSCNALLSQVSRNQINHVRKRRGISSYTYQVPENAQDHESQDDNHAGDHARDDGFIHTAVIGVIVVARLRHDVCHLHLRRDIDSFSALFLWRKGSMDF